MKTTLLLSILVASTVAATAASALTIVNRDAEEREIMISEAGDEQIFVLEPEQSITDVCMSGCMIAPGEDDPVEVDGSGTVAIVDGKLVREE